MIKFNIPVKINSSIGINEYFATLIEENESYYRFRFVFNMLQSEIVKYSIEKVVIEVSNPIVTVDNLNNQLINGLKFDIKKPVPDKLGKFQINNILSGPLKKIDDSEKKKNSIICSAELFIQPYLTIDAVPFLKKGMRPEDIPQLFSFVNTLESIEIGRNRTISPITNNNNRDNNLRLLGIHKIDPAQAVLEAYDKIPEAKNIRNFYLNFAINSLPRENIYYVERKKRKNTNKIFLSTVLNIPKNLSSSFLDVNFKLFQSKNNSPIDSKTKNLPLGQHVKYFKTPTGIPTPRSYSNSITVKQAINANSIKLKEKFVDGISFGSFNNLFEGSLDANKEKVFYTDILGNDSNLVKIIRCQSFNNPSTLGNSFFSSLVHGPDKRIIFDPTSLIIEDDFNSNNTLFIKVLNSPTEYSHLKVVRQIQISKEHFSDPTDVISYQPVNSNNVIIDKNVIDNKVYRYTVYYRREDGTQVPSISQIYRYLDTTTTQGISTKIDGIIYDINKDEPEIRFTISSKIEQNSQIMSRIKLALQSSNLYGSYGQFVESNKEKLDKLIINKVVRVNHKTGQREEFPFLTQVQANFIQDVFTDNAETRKRFGVSNIDPTANYTYEVRSSVRDPMSLFKEYMVEVDIPWMGRKYRYHPYKWVQPSVIKTGVILPQDEKGNLYSEKDLQEDGEIGVTAIHTTSFEDLSKFMAVTNLSAERLDLNKIKLTWDTNGKISDYDHFVLVKELGKNRKIIGSTMIREALVTLEILDRGTLIYYVIPVMKDFSVGSAIRSNALLIDPEELNYQMVSSGIGVAK